MNQDSIRSRIEAIDFVVSGFASDIDMFKTDISQKMLDIDAAMNRLSSSWEGTLYQNFEEKMQERQHQIRNSLARAGSLKEKLDGIASEMKAMLAVLNAAGDDE